MPRSDSGLKHHAQKPVEAHQPTPTPSDTPLYRIAPSCVFDLTATDLGHMTALLFAMPMIEENRRTATGQWYGDSYHGRATLADALAVSERTVTNIIGKLNEDQGITAKVRQRADHTTALEIDYRLHRNRKMQIPAPLATITRPAARGNAVKVYAHLQSCPPWERTRNDIADSLRITRRATAAALVDLRNLDLIDRNHDPEPGKVRRPDAVQYASDKTCTSRVTKPAISRDKRRHQTLPGDSSAFPPYAVTENGDGENEIQHHPAKTIADAGAGSETMHRWDDLGWSEGDLETEPVGSYDPAIVRDARMLAGHLLDELTSHQRASSNEHQTIVANICRLVSWGKAPVDIAATVDDFHLQGPLSEADNRPALLAYRLKHLAPRDVKPRSDLLYAQPPDPHRRPTPTNPAVIEAARQEEIGPVHGPPRPRPKFTPRTITTTRPLTPMQKTLAEMKAEAGEQMHTEREVDA